MLKSVHLSNFAIASEVSFDLRPGMTAITGETGAGKSIMVDALKLICGQKADESWIRDGASQSVITAVFDVSDLPKARDAAFNVGIDEDEVILRRVIRRGRRSSNTINGHPVTLTEMDQISRPLIDICGQHAHIELLDRKHQLSLLDRIGADMSPSYHNSIQSTREAFIRWKDADRRLTETREMLKANQDKRRLLEYELNELNELDPQVGEFEQISKEYDILQNADADSSELAGIASIFGGQDFLSKLSQSSATLEELSSRHEGLENSAKMVNSVRVEVEEIVSDLQSVRDGIPTDPDRCRALNERMSEYFRLAKKHFVSADQLADHRINVLEELESLPTSADLDPLEEEVLHARSSYEKHASRLRESRLEVGNYLANDVMAVLVEIGLEHAKLEFQILDGVSTAEGWDQLDILFSANVGQSPQPLRRVASGGELSRIALGFQVVEARYSSLPTMIFDEVDVGISGHAARRVGEMLKQIGTDGQCLVITHQAPVADIASHHLMVSKEHGRHSTSTSLEELTGKNRQDEVHRMTGIES